MSDSRPIGIFDSGVGGLTVLNALKKHLPSEHFIYVGDTARVPYGNKSKSLIQQYSKEILDFLILKNCKMVVVACNTASSLALPYLRSLYSLPIEGVIEAGVDEALKNTTNNHVGVLGTQSTIKSAAYETKLVEGNSKLSVTNQACPLFVPLAEEGWIGGDIPENIAKVYLNPLIEAGVDSIILGCTHYPLLKNIISNVVPSSVDLIDSAIEISKKVSAILYETDSSTNPEAEGELECFVTDSPTQFMQVAERFVDFKIREIKLVELS